MQQRCSAISPQEFDIKLAANPSTMKIAYVYDLIYLFTKSGAEMRFWELSRRMAAKGHEVYLVGMKFWNGADIINHDGVYLCGVCPAVPIYNKKGTRSLWQVLYFTCKLFGYLRRADFDVIDCNGFPYLPFFAVKWFCSRKKIPLVVTWQEVWGRYCRRYFGILMGFIAQRVEKLIIQSSPVIIAHTDKVRDDLISAGAKKDSVLIIPDGVDCKSVQDALPHREASDIIFVGRLIEHKNIGMLIDAVEVLKRRRPDIKCLVIGKGPLEAALRAKAESLNLDKNIIFKTAVEYGELISYLKASRVFVFPSLREGFGIAPLEAMAAGLPVIVVRAPMNAAVELVKEGINGFICDLGPEQIAQKTGILLSDEVLRSKIGFQAKEFAKDYDWDKIADKNERLYKEVAS